MVTQSGCVVRSGVDEGPGTQTKRGRDLTGQGRDVPLSSKGRKSETEITEEMSSEGTEGFRVTEGISGR